MKKFFTLLFAAVLLSAVFCTAVAAEIPADARFEVFDLTPSDADVEWYADGRVMAVPNDGDTPLSVASGDYPLRYLFILVFDKDGVCVEVGNNLLSADDEKAASFPQHEVTIPAKGFGVFFYYNANEGPSNLALYEYYEELGGTVYSNETGNPISGKNYVAVLENNTVTVYFASANAPAESSAPEESSEEPSDEPSEAVSEESPAESSAAPAASEEPSAAVSSEETAETSSEAPAASDATSSQGEESSSNTGIIVGVIIAVVAVAAVAVGVVIAKAKVKKKKG